MTREELIQNLTDGNYTLSFSALKAFSKSPSHFISYKLGDKPATEAMKKGSLIHCAILEPEELVNRYAILNRDELPNPDKDFRDSANKAYRLDFEAQAKESGKEIVTPEQWAEAEKYRDMAYQNEVIGSYLSKLIHKEKYVEFEFRNHKFRGVIDGLSKSFVLDLKTVADANPSKLKWLCMDSKYHWQHFLYNQSDLVPGYFENFNLITDGDGMYLAKMEWHNLNQAEWEISELLDKFETCRLNNLWHQNYEFWAGEKGYFTIN